MIFEEVKLYNFGIYKGEHIVCLDSPDPFKPVILIGALNGAGKTTFLDALQLALYGKHAKCSNRGKLSYSAYLERNINRFAEKQEASISLRFRHGDSNQNRHTYEVIRSWSKDQGKECRETTVVKLNGISDDLLSDNWEDFVNEFIPQSISELFFFDGEKIETLADPKRSAELLKTGIEALLGLEVLSKLSNDLSVIRRRKQEKQLNQVDLSQIETLNKEIQELEKNKEKVNDKLGEYYKTKGLLEEEYESIQNMLTSSGADKLSLKEKLDEAKAILQKNLFETEHEIIKITSGVLPLGLIEDLLRATETQLKKEKKVHAYKNAENIIKEQQGQLLLIISEAVADNNLLTIIKDKIASENEKLKQEQNIICYLDNVNVAISDIIEKVNEDKNNVADLLRKKGHIQDDIALLQRKLATIPKLKDVQHIIEENAKQEEKIKTINDSISQAASHRLEIESKIKNIKSKYESLLMRTNAETFEQRRQAQIIKHIDTLKLILNDFNEQMIQENITKLENRIKSKFDQLKRKDHFIERLKINAVDFSISLYTRDMKLLSTDRLSAGERQLFAIAILWGLADCSGKELPTIIDTPMGRLDGKHRTNLVEKYFPLAASQVILLSTDEEISGSYYNKLKPYIAKEYYIDYDESNHSSFFHPGYLEVVK
ncbi:DNA sulfur modification protein DndD [Franconibacter sp. IITDAS19]|uniref:DNA sulfur modification protein DndD n=1 Tax=Franconibacter sp. IITDAS19 TaxID=2930569 RepID=UPI001FFAD0AC|nr:DNA sulfur modification protein DndD [Franconibacter sp. IITDAS19]MCK1969296.1 DNA sulfur modification protein DndD [Franconibacter sp. IITDAS19]